MNNESKYDYDKHYDEVISDEESCNIVTQQISVKHHDKQCWKVNKGGFGRVVSRKWNISFEFLGFKIPVKWCKIR